MRRQVVLLVGTLTLVAASLIAVIAAGLSPVLGLDLQGGISVVLQPVGPADDDSLDVAVDIIRNRVDALGVAEPEISRQGDNIVIDLPGVKERDKARRLVGKTAELQFRPVLATYPPGPTTPDAMSQCPAKGKIDKATPEDRDQFVVFPDRESDDAENPLKYCLGPTVITGEETSDADSTFDQSQGYYVELTFTDEGLASFNELAGQSFGQASPTNQVAIVLDGEVQSAPAFQSPTYDSQTVTITGDFSRTDAEDLGQLLRYGALPVQLEELTTQDVSPTLGKDQLQAGVAAGIIGIALVALYMVAYYRILGLVVIAGLTVTACATYAMVCWLGESVGLALTLAGVTGLIVSVGVTVDSYIVYFERLKDEVRTGKTVRSSVDRGFHQAFRTILAADLVSLIGAVILYLLAIGSVRGFAFFLGLATLIDLIISYTFMHPLVTILARRPGLVRAPFVGIGAGLDVKEATA